jgi:glycosyltransferase involved in cell wall biosynthesis
LSGVQKIVFTVHGWAWNEKRPYYQKVLIALLYWLTLLLSSTNIVVSKAARTQAKYFPFVQRKFHVVYNGIHPLKFLTREGARTQLLKNAQDRFWVGTIAELHPIKGLDVLIEAFEQFLVQYPESELIIIGEGEERYALETEIAHRNLSSRVHLVGHKRDAATLLAAFDIFVLPSRSEGLAYVLLEAGQARLPVLATKVGGIPEVIEHGETGLLVPYGNLPLLTKELKYLASNQTVRRVLGDALHAHVDSDFSIPQMLTNTFALYEPKYS